MITSLEAPHGFDFFRPAQGDGVHARRREEEPLRSLQHAGCVKKCELRCCKKATNDALAA